MNKYLYFATGAPNDSGANEEVVMMPANKVTHFEIAETTKLDVWFESGVSQETNTGDGDIHVDHTWIRLIITTGKHKEVMADIANSIELSREPMVVIGDSENSRFASSYISSVQSINLIDAS